ncbi:MAG: hypothetical protein PHH09_11560 [Methanoregulaceae archaeon]|jgi:hypothetical protein|nr:hypothetical protein [Methanoregulaceae archaeon]MDD5049555.1 hypothetical protein [Methanoregulaceae archaeon]
MSWKHLMVATIAILFCILVVSLHLASLTENDWIAAQEANHPPTVDVTRDGDGVWIRWYGGWTSSFIDHIKVSSTMMPERLYPKPHPGQYIHYPMVPENTTITISVWDNAVHSYHIIKTVEV